MSKNYSKLLYYKWLHTIIWAYLAFNIFYVLAAGIFGFLNFYVYFSIISIFVEMIVLLMFKWRCPITVVAEKYTKNPEVGFDIFLPKVIAKYNKTIFSIIFTIGLLLILLRRFYS
jgi:hypothetical protein